MGKVPRAVWPLGCFVVGALLGSYATWYLGKYSRGAAAVGDAQLLSSYLAAQYANGTPSARRAALLDYLAMLKRMESAPSEFYPMRIIAVDEALTYARLSEVARHNSDTAAAAKYLASAEALCPFLKWDHCSGADIVAMAARLDQQWLQGQPPSGAHGS